MTPLQKRCVDISYRHKLTHVSSVLNCVEVIESIYAMKARNDAFVLGNSHASLALFVVLEAKRFCDAEAMVLEHGTHANRDMEHGVWVSGGSLGQAETVAVGLALAKPERNVWLVTSDGACMEGSLWEAFRFGRKLRNLQVEIVYNGLGAYGPIDRKIVEGLADMVGGIIHEVDQEEYPEWLRGLAGHYLTLTAEQHKELMQ